MSVENIAVKSMPLSAQDIHTLSEFFPLWLLSFTHLECNYLRSTQLFSRHWLACTAVPYQYCFETELIEHGKFAFYAESSAMELRLPSFGFTGQSASTHITQHYSTCSLLGSYAPRCKLANSQTQGHYVKHS